jgi:diacylglycerol kinase (ATP)
VDWRQKKAVGPLAYLLAGLKALGEKKPRITAGGVSIRAAPAGELVLIGNGKLYGGPFEIFPAADLRDGVLEVCVMPRVDWPIFLRCIPGLVTRQKIPETLIRRFRAAEFELTGDMAAAFELDGEWAGKLPAVVSVERARLRVAVP